MSRLAQVDDILAREGDILVYPGFTCQTSKSPITQGAPPTQWPVGPWNPKMLSLLLFVYLSGPISVVLESYIFLIGQEC